MDEPQHALPRDLTGEPAEYKPGAYVLSAATETLHNSSAWELLEAELLDALTAEIRKLHPLTAVGVDTAAPQRAAALAGARAAATQQLKVPTELGDAPKDLLESTDDVLVGAEHPLHRELAP